ncbi:hypothetical protein [Dethiothermospora halolimnae]|uniref:hypothetical protein n=1 Tax=Dethiothermospora halolimnae TaxID=3114390 RepID=UPI003CCBC33C
MNKKKRIIVLFLVAMTMLMIVSNIAFADHVVDEWIDKIPFEGLCLKCEKMRVCTDINNPNSCRVETGECWQDYNPDCG